jgi:cell wall-associated NlpC family hydrolase
MKNGTAEAVLEAARSRHGQPFEHHFSPLNLCMGGQITLPGCMERGLGENGYDCSGLIVASVCEALDADRRQWNPLYRHLFQIACLEREQPPTSGDIVIFHPSTFSRDAAHMGLWLDDERVVHASGRDPGLVEIGPVEGNYQRIGTVPLEVLIEVALK